MNWVKDNIVFKDSSYALTMTLLTQETSYVNEIGWFLATLQLLAFPRG